MDTYFIRHTDELDIDDATRRKLWEERRIAIHFPREKDGKLHKRDNPSLDLGDYANRDRRAMRALIALAKDGAYVCAEYFQRNECVLGYIKPASSIELFRGTWGSSNECDGREAILKSLRLEKVKLIRPCHSAVILVGRPRQGTITRWKIAGKTIENIVEGKRTKPTLGLLSNAQQEILCSEFLRSSGTERLGFPKLVHLLLPVGRTMRGIDICGISESGSMVFAQVTYLDLEHCDAKLDALVQYRDAEKNDLVLFCNCAEPTEKSGIRIFPLRTVYDAFATTETGKLWIERAANPI